MKMRMLAKILGAIDPFQYLTRSQVLQEWVRTLHILPIQLHIESRNCIKLLR
jgi:hypothetical protein